MQDESVSKKRSEHKAGRTAVPLPIQREVLIEAGYRCAVPTCRTILAIDLHHLEEVADGGGNAPSNLIALCPTCHALYHRGTIHRDALYSWKCILVALGQAFDREAIDALQFLARLKRNVLGVSGDGVLRFSRLISAGLADFRLMMQNGPLVMYEVFLTPYGKLLLEAWNSGNRRQVEAAMNMRQSPSESEATPVPPALAADPKATQVIAAPVSGLFTQSISTAASTITVFNASAVGGAGSL